MSTDTNPTDDAADPNGDNAENASSDDGAVPGAHEPATAASSANGNAGLEEEDLLIVDEGDADATPTVDDGAAKLAELEAERDKLREQLLRTAADFDNFRKRMRRELTDATRKGKEDTLREILAVIDNLERAVTASENAKDVKSVADGVRMVLRQFDEIAGRLQLTRLSALGDRFDPTLHDAVQQVETTDVPPGTITMEITSGYRLGDKLLRPALVVVAKAPPGAVVAENGESAAAALPDLELGPNGQDAAPSEQAAESTIDPSSDDDDAVKA